jgi:hypothetical protein
LYVVPAFGVLLGLVLFAASRTVAKDMEKLQSWMRESTQPEVEAGTRQPLMAPVQPATALETE